MFFLFISGFKSSREPIVSDYIRRRLSEQEGTLAFQQQQKEKMLNDGQF